MARTHSRLAKLTRPDAAGLLLRERLFALLDRTQRGQFAWISGAGGAGKTSLVSSWLDQRGHNALWYRVDTADRDPATFFHYLGLAVAGQARPLPHFTPEYLAGLSDFARRYFRDFFARVRAPCVVVFDNCHEAGADSPLESILAWALEEAPSGVAIVGVSRKDPGEPFARSIADARFVHITTQDLALDEGEARDIAKARGQDQSDVSALLAQVDGWAAGFIMMLRAHARTVETHDAFIDGQHAIFNYFAAEILAAGGGRLRDFLLRTAVLPIVSPSLAKRLTGFSESAALLADLHFGHFFTERRSRVRDEPLYEYHPLFREFLIAQARQTLGTEAFATHCRQAAALLDETGRMEAAVALRIMAADWSALVKAISTHASVLMGQGRWQTLREWIEAVPHAVAEAQPWVLYWRGICAYMVNPAVGRTDLEAAYHQFQAAGESMGSLLACAGVLEAGYLEFADQKASLPWVDEINRLLAASPPMPPEVEMRVIQSLLGVWMAQPQHPLVARWAARAAQLLRTFPDARGGAGLIAFAAAYCVWAGDYVGARAIVNQFDLDRRAIEGDPLSALTLCAMRAGVGWQNGDHEEAYAMIRLAQEIADNSGVHVLDSFILAQAVYTALSARDLPQAEHEIGRLRAQLIPRRKLDVAQFGSLDAGVALLAGRTADAMEMMGREIPVSEALGAPFVTATFRIQFAQILVSDGRHEAAAEPLREALAFARSMPSHILEFQSLLTIAWASFRGGDATAGLVALRAGLAIGRTQNYMNCHPLWIPEMMREIFSRALDADIESDYVRRFIRKRRLAPGPRDTSSWPWAIRIYTLGQFEIRKDGVALQSTGKAQQRVLDLLKTVIAHGPRGAAAEGLAELLWPQAEGDGARDALRVALHRLRRLLGGEQAVIVSEGKASLNPDWCWVDAFAFEQAMDAAQPMPADELLDIYRGHFLPAEGEQPWLMRERERLRSKFHRAIETGGTRLVQAANIDDAIDLYRRATEIDPLAEGLYRRLMDCYARLDRTAEAMEVYRRCRQMLSIVLGIKPAPETEALHAALSTGTLARQIIDRS